MPTCSWFQITPGKGQFANYFCLVTPSQNLALYSRPTGDPTFSNGTPNSAYSDQHFGFEWEEMAVDKVEFDLDAAKIVSSRPITLGEQVIANKSDTEQELMFRINKSVTDSSAFEYSSGFPATVGMNFVGAY